MSSLTGSNSPPTASNHFVPPRDLALHLACIHPSRPHPLALPHSTIHYCLRAIIDLATVAFAPAGFIDFRPFKRYFDIGFQSEEDAEAAAQTPLIYKKPHSHNSYSPPFRHHVFYDQLVAGLMAYGTHPNLIFAIPSAHLSCGGLSSVPKTMYRGGPVSGLAPAWPAHPLLPPNFPESPCSDISKLFDDAEVAVMNVATLASFNPSAKITCHTHKESKVFLAAFVETLSCHYLDEEVENSYYTDLHPHYVDAPIPWLSALIWYCNQHPLIEVGLSENQHPDPPHPLPWWVSSFCFPPG
ncbi:hypothetical protein L0F63_001172 [Massospora cicadina]|nr:hypothetical protein L0F63_001172 [Massospora cicadina]